MGGIGLSDAGGGGRSGRSRWTGERAALRFARGPRAASGRCRGWRVPGRCSIIGQSACARNENKMRAGTWPSCWCGLGRSAGSVFWLRQTAFAWTVYVLQRLTGAPPGRCVRSLRRPPGRAAARRGRDATASGAPIRSEPRAARGCGSPGDPGSAPAREVPGRPASDGA